MVGKTLFIVCLLATGLWLIKSEPKKNKLGAQSNVTRQLNTPEADQNKSAAISQATNLPIASGQEFQKPTKFNDLSLSQQKELARKEGALFFEVHGKHVVAFGDVLLGQIDANVTTGFTKAAVPKLWPSSTIPFAIDKNVSQKKLLEEIIDEFNGFTFLQLVEATTEDQNVLIFTEGEDHCYSYLGFIGKFQPIYLNTKCGRREILHEIFHALGFIHEHSRTDRDQFIQINWDNIEDGFESQFDMIPDIFMDRFNRFEYDPHSIMHYNAQAFAKNGSTTIVSKQSGFTLGNSRPSPSDLDRLRHLYRGR